MRTKTFNVQEALAQAVQLFWRQGYDGTSMTDLVQAMGINRQSIYDTFGDKHRLFILALDAYYTQTKAEITAKLAATTGLQATLQAIFMVYAQRDAATPKGCLIVNSATELGLVDAEVNDLVQAYFNAEKAVLNQVLSQYQASLRLHSDIPALASRLQNALVGIRVQARIGQPQIDAIIDATIASLPWKENR